MINILISYLLAGAAEAMILFLWFKTDAFVAYLFLLNLDWFHIKEYIEVTVDSPENSYPEYLIANYPSFFTKLISCLKCLSIWVSIFLNILAFISLNVVYSWHVWLGLPLSVLITSYCGLCMFYKLVTLNHE